MVQGQKEEDLSIGSFTFCFSSKQTDVRGARSREQGGSWRGDVLKRGSGCGRINAADKGSAASNRNPSLKGQGHVPSEEAIASL